VWNIGGASAVHEIRQLSVGIDPLYIGIRYPSGVAQAASNQFGDNRLDMQLDLVIVVHRTTVSE
jgi:hypothetical protein